MNSLKESILRVFKGASTALFNYPSTIGYAFAFTLVTFVRIQMDWPEQQSFNFLFNCLHLSLAFGAIFSLALLTGIKSKINTKMAFVTGNVISVLIVMLVFLLLYTTSGVIRDPSFDVYKTVSDLAAARITVLMALSMLAFIIFASSNETSHSISRSLFMTQKAFFIAAIYSAVILAGTSGVIGAFQALVYPEMSSKVYQYASTLIGFLAFTLFVGYFPDFSNDSADSRREDAENQPRFIEVLFGNIMVPLIIAMTGVLLLWTVRILASGIQIPFVQLSSIAASYAFFGIWLHLMLSEHTSKLSLFFKKGFPYAALLILCFEAYALFKQLNIYGLKTTEYFFILVWIAAVTASILLIIKKSSAHKIIIYVISILAVFSVLPAVGYHSLPARTQINRLEKQLTTLGILNNGQLEPAVSEPDATLKFSITESVSFLATSEHIDLPTWFDPDLNQSNVFKAKLGFEQSWPNYDSNFNQGQWVSVILPSDPIDISEYNWAISLNNYIGPESIATSSIQGRNGTYRFEWIINTRSGVPNLKIYLDELLIVDENMKVHVDLLIEKYLNGPANTREAELNDMMMKIDIAEAKILLVFDTIELSVDSRDDSINYWINLKSAYFSEK